MYQTAGQSFVANLRAAGGPAPMTSLLPHGALFARAADVKSACSDAYQDALRWARRDCGRGSYHSRGRHLRAMRGGELVYGEAETCPWDGTLKSLVAAIDDARFGHGADLVSIEGGIDYATTPREYADCNYDPWVGEWEVVVWRKPE